MQELTVTDSHTVLVKKDTLIQAPMDDAIILLCLDNSKYYGGDKIAADIWLLIDGVRSLSAIAESLSIEYDAPIEAILKDVCDFADELLAEGLLRVA